MLEFRLGDIGHENKITEAEPSFPAIISLVRRGISRLTGGLAWRRWLELHRVVFIVCS
jgi:hypothetical protein